MTKGSALNDRNDIVRMNRIMSKLFIIICPLLIANKCPPDGPGTAPVGTHPLFTSRSTGNYAMPNSNKLNGFLDRTLSSPSHCGVPVTTNDRSAGSIRGEPQIYFNACDPAGGMTARYFENRRCTRSRKISRPFHHFLRRNMKSCVQQSTKKDVHHVNLIHVGIAGDKNHTSRSLHSVNRAIDIKTFEITYKDGSTEKIHSNQQLVRQDFFQKFAMCWSSAIVSQNSSPCPGSIPKGYVGRESPKHRQHIHISLPYCPRKHDLGVK